MSPNDDNNNNWKTIASLSLNRIELSGTPSTGVGQTHSPGTMQSLLTNDQMEWKFRIMNISRQTSTK